MKTVAKAILITICAMFVASASFADSNAIVGSWQLTNATTGSLALVTFTDDGTQILTVAGFPAGHGAWEKIGSRSFTAKTVAIAGGNADPVTISTVTEVLEVSSDGESYSSEFETVITLADGTEIARLTGSVDATRISAPTSSGTDDD